MGSSIIQWAQAKTMLKEYRRNSNALKVPVLNTETEAYEDHTLKGLRVSREHIEEIFENEEVDELFIMFAVRWSDIEEVDDDDQYFTTVIVGIADDEIQTECVVDFCDPCPTNCPVNFDAALA